MKKNKSIPNFKIHVEKIIEVEVESSLSLYISQRIKTIQKQKKISSKEMFEKGEFSNQTSIARIRKGDNLISIETLYLICKVLDCKSSDILPF